MIVKGAEGATNRDGISSLHGDRQSLFDEVCLGDVPAAFMMR